ncbi:MAG: FUSC family protein [Acetobacteraceae bacterium]|nr:FUSC family protein [Acetobacteraceae bacterium]
MTPTGLAGSVLAELGEMARAPPHARFATAAALAVGLASLTAIWLRFADPWWAGITALACVGASRPASFATAAARVTGTAIGAVGAWLAAPWVANHLALAPPLLLLCSTVAVLGGEVTSHKYAWVMGGVTADLVLLGLLADPATGGGLPLARSAAIALGAVVALFVAWLVIPAGAPAREAPAPGWPSLLGPNRYLLGHGLRTGAAVMLVPLLWSWLAVPDLSQMAISLAAVMAVPDLSSDPDQANAVLRERGHQRLAGCFLGGAAGLGALALGLSALLPWLAILLGGVWVGASLQASERGIGYVGRQATVAFIILMVDGFGPPLSLVPGLSRFVGIALGVGLLLALLAVWPDPRTDSGTSFP